jgi:hypothetical protein
MSEVPTTLDYVSRESKAAPTPAWLLWLRIIGLVVAVFSAVGAAGIICLVLFHEC